MTQPSPPLVSVVTPFYNTAAYLADCIESVRRQTYPNFEYLLIDNQSTDGSAEIARRYAAEDSRIRVVRNESLLNQVQNYNRGLSLISENSTYTKMVEADNWIYPQCLGDMVAVAEQHPAVVVVGAYAITERRVRFLGLPQAVVAARGRDIARMHFLEDAYLFGAPTTVLMRSSTVRARRPFFDEGTWFVEDLSAMYELLREGDFGFVHQILTFIRTENEGTIQSARKGYHTMALDRWAVLTRHGRDFLAPDEFARANRATRATYYDWLAQGVLTRQPRAYWQYHRECLAEFRQTLEPWRVAWHVAGRLGRMAANPGRTVRAALKAWSGRST